MKHKTLVLTLAGAAIAATAVSAIGVSAASGQGGMFKNEAVKAALAKGDYEAFKSAVAENLPSKDEFEVMAARESRRTRIQAAIESGDYSAWKSEMDGSISELQSSINEDNFKKLQEAMKLREAGDMDGAREIMQGLHGLMGGMGGEGMGRGGGMHRGGK